MSATFIDARVLRARLLQLAITQELAARVVSDAALRHHISHPQPLAAHVAAAPGRTQVRLVIS